MDYSAVLLASDESVEELERSISGLRNQSVPPEKIILVTDSIELKKRVSGDKEMSILQKDGGIGRAREIGYDYADTAWILFTDADTVLPHSFVEKSSSVISEENLDAVGGKVVAKSEFIGSSIFEFSTNMASFGKGHSTLIRRDVLDFKEVPEDRGEDSVIWNQADSGKLLDSPKVRTDIPTVNHKRMGLLASLIGFYLLYRWFQ